jgi:SWI/SNF related-matrix-associated actin-dependent regulator of chromatin subfamily C
MLIELCAKIENALEVNNCLTYPVCYLRHEIESQTADRLKDIIKKHKGTLANSQDEADHIIYPAIAEKNTEEWIRVVQKRGRDALIHKWYKPDSLDIWIQNIDIDEPEPNENGGVWNINANWILDTDKFNEWMNQEDYEVIVENGDYRLKKPAHLRKVFDEVNNNLFLLFDNSLFYSMFR